MPWCSLMSMGTLFFISKLELSYGKYSVHKVLMKIYGHFYFWWITLKKLNLLSPVQSGFRRHSMESVGIYFTDEIRRNANAGRLAGSLFVDLENAFDSVLH